jgi:hypothetical protein
VGCAKVWTGGQTSLPARRHIEGARDCNGREVLAGIVWQDASHHIAASGRLQVRCIVCSVCCFMPDESFCLLIVWCSAVVTAREGDCAHGKGVATCAMCSPALHYCHNSWATRVWARMTCVGSVEPVRPCRPFVSLMKSS